MGLTATSGAASFEYDGNGGRVRKVGLVHFRRQVTAVLLCYDVVVRTTLDIPDEPYYLAKAIARDLNRSLGQVVGDLILQSANRAKGAGIEMSEYGFPTFHCTRPVTTEDVRALEDDE